MGIISSAKVPKLIKKRDGNEPVKVFKQGGKVKKLGLGGILDPIGANILPTSITQSKYYDPLGDSAGMDTARNKMLDVDKEKANAAAAKAARWWEKG